MRVRGQRGGRGGPRGGPTGQGLQAWGASTLGVVGVRRPGRQLWGQRRRGKGGGQTILVHDNGGNNFYNGAGKLVLMD